MKQPPSIQPADRPGPGYDPMDRIVQDLQNIQAFISYLIQNPKDLNYLQSHLSHILRLRRGMAEQIKQLSNDPYSYPPARLSLLLKENEQIFSLVEGIVGAIDPWKPAEFKKFEGACEAAIAKFDRDLTP